MSNEMIPFNKPHVTGKEITNLEKLFKSAVKFSGNGEFSQLCHEYFKKTYAVNHCLLTTSCTDALEMCAILINLKPGDEVIMPSYTFVSTANAFLLRGAKIVFADSMSDHPNIDATLLESLITPKTKAIVVVHYAGIACDMDSIMSICRKHSLYCIEDAAQGIGAKYNGQYLGTIGDLGSYSFHETKNIICGEGGLLIVTNKQFVLRSEIIWEKGTNRSSFFRGEVDKYNWVDIGSSFLPSELNSAFLYAQLSESESINAKRMSLWKRYYKNLSEILDGSNVMLPTNPTNTENNGHIFYLVAESMGQRDSLIDYLKSNNVHSVFHYQPLHSSPFYNTMHDGRELDNCDRFAACLLRLPLFPDLKLNQVDMICDRIGTFFEK